METLRLNLPSGRAATAITLATMAELTHYAGTTEAMRDAAIDIVRGYYATSPAKYAAAVALFCRRNVMLISEPDEILIDPCKMLTDIARGRGAGDCDDISMLSMALCFALGLQCRFKAVFPAPEGHYQHVFGEIRLNPNAPWLPMDLTILGSPEYPPDWIVQEI
jgi:transglutaminase-like putative cysteine protease